MASPRGLCLPLVRNRLRGVPMNRVCSLVPASLLLTYLSSQKLSRSRCCSIFGFVPRFPRSLVQPQSFLASLILHSAAMPFLLHPRGCFVCGGPRLSLLVPCWFEEDPCSLGSLGGVESSAGCCRCSLCSSSSSLPLQDSGRRTGASRLCCSAVTSSSR